MSWLVWIFTNMRSPPRRKPHLTSVIFKSDGRDDCLAFSTAFSSPWPNAVRGCMAAAPANAAPPRNERLLFFMVFSYTLPVVVW